MSFIIMQQNNYGSGLYIVFENDPKENEILILNSIFEDNKSIYTGGGVNVWYFFSEDFSPTTNVVEFLGCEFNNNNAKGGGGIGLTFSSSKTTDMTMNNTICFVDCTWNSNTAKVGAAVDVVPYEGVNVHKFDLFKIKFTNSDISNNSHTKSMTETNGAMFIQELDVTFGGKTTFTNNIGTSLYIASSTITFEAMSHVRFNNNTAIHGSALNMIGASTININDYSTFIFSENTACAGSAILQVSNNPNDRTLSRSCFMKYIGNKPIDQRKINFHFDTNKAECENFGNSVHVATFLPCNYTDKYKCAPSIASNESMLGCIANFTFTGNVDNIEVSTDVTEIKLDIDTLSVIPGVEIHLPIHFIDELNNTASCVHVAALSGETSEEIKVDKDYIYTDKNKIKIYGYPGDSATLSIAIGSTNYIGVEINVILSQCPPGYVISPEKECICYANSKLNGYKCITSCNDNITNAVLDKNYWIGYVNANVYDNEELVYAYCPRKYCLKNNTPKLLTNNSNSDSQLICNPYRSGKICSQCIDSYTAHYHSDSYECDTTKSCNQGWLYYMLSELLPVTILFLVIVVSDIKLTSGTVNGFIYFAQTVNVIILHMRYSQKPKTLNVLLQMHSFIVDIFNLSFFQIDSLSFCLWPNAQTLDMLMFRYVTTIYSLLLLLLIVISAHKCHGGSVYIVSNLFSI